MLSYVDDKIVVESACIHEYDAFLIKERSQATAEKYVRDVKKFKEFLAFLGEEDFGKEQVQEYKNYLYAEYKISSANSMLAAMNSFFEYMGWDECKVKLFQINKEMVNRLEKGLAEKEYQSLIRTAKKNGEVRMSLLLQTICSTGIRISELEFITVEALKLGYAEIYDKGKSRIALFPAELVKILHKYCKEKGITGGQIFITSGGRPRPHGNY